MALVNETRIEIRRFQLETAMREYNELWDAWKLVESKAQPLFAMAGVFLAGVFTYASSSAASSASWLVKALLMLLAVTLVVAIFQALRAVWVVDVSSPHLGSDAQAIVNDILDAGKKIQLITCTYDLKT